MTRLRSNNVFGTITNNPLAVGGTTLNAAGLVNLVAVAGVDRAVITLDPNRVNGAPEIVYVTAHTGSATSATILRGQEGTAAREHPLGTFWVHAPTAVDYGVGQIGYAQVVASQGGITAEVDLTGLSVPVTVGTGRRIRITGYGLFQSTVADDVAELRIKEGTTLLNLWTGTMRPANVNSTADACAILAPSAGAHTYKLTGIRNIGTGTLTFGAAATLPASILVEDLGPV